MTTSLDVVQSPSSPKMTPLMSQFWEIKNHHLDKILLFRMGDFYEMFYDDAKIAAPVVGIALTSRNKKSLDETPMCGVPHHSIAGPISKLLSAGHKIAICDQLEDPALAKGIVKRGVTRILTPGMVYDPDTLLPTQNLYVCAFDRQTLAFLDTSTKEAFYFDCDQNSERLALIEMLAPVEIVIADEAEKQTLHAELFGQKIQLQRNWNPLFSLSSWREEFTKSSQPLSVQRLKHYVHSLSSGNPADPQLSNWLEVPFTKRSLGKSMEISERTLNHLEILKSQTQENTGSLYFAIDRTLTPGGSRTLKDWLRFPLRDIPLIQKRQSRIENWFQSLADLQSLRSRLQDLGDIPRRLSKVTSPQSHPRDFWSLWHSLSKSILVGEFLTKRGDPWNASWQNILQELQAKIEKTFVEEPPNQMKNGGYIRRGLSKELDEWIDLSENSQALLQDLEIREKKSTGISSLKIRYNGVFGYYIEITNTHKDKIPETYQRKQTLANAERFVTPELTILEQKLLSAQSKRLSLEREILRALQDHLQKLEFELLEIANSIHELDVFSSLAWLAHENQWTKPTLLETGCLTLLGSRHPVVEQVLRSQFTPNDVLMQEGGCLLITGPNMAGKSTLMRQVALNILLAQMGSYVPCREATVPIFDNIFTRIGASDSLSEGLSTFMVEMKESSEIMTRATERSLVVLDEIGRGTSTYDGLSLAQSMLEFFVTEKKSRVLFATHYHELVTLSENHTQIENMHMGIFDNGQEIHFLYTLRKGPANKSYGIHVAKLAGLPPSVIERAKHLLREFENQGFTAIQKPATPTAMENSQLDLFEKPTANQLAILQKIEKLNINELTPLQSLNCLSDLKLKLSQDSLRGSHISN